MNRATLAFLLLPVVALAQDAVALAPEDDVTHLAQQLFAAITSGNWWLAAAVGVLLLVVALRSQVVRKLLPAKLAEMLDHPVVAFSLPLLTALGLGLATAAVAGPVTAPVLVAVVLGALKVSMGAITTYVGAKKVAEARAEAKEKAAAVDTKTEAIAELRGPQP